MPAALSKRDVKDAIREAMDELTVKYAHGAGAFVDTVMQSSAEMADAFDDFYTRNLIEDRPPAAKLFVELRLRSARKLQEIVAKKVRVLEGYEAELARGGRNRSASAAVKSPTPRRRAKRT